MIDVTEKIARVARETIFRLILVPLIRRDLLLREAGKRPDEWHWADLLALRWGFIEHKDYPEATA